MQRLSWWLVLDQHEFANLHLHDRKSSEKLEAFELSEFFPVQNIHDSIDKSGTEQLTRLTAVCQVRSLYAHSSEAETFEAVLRAMVFVVITSILTLARLV